MSRAPRVALAGVAGVILVTASATAQNPAPGKAKAVEFPMDVATQVGPLGSWEYAPRPAEFTGFKAHDALTMSSVKLPSGETVQLDLERIDFDFEKLGVHVDGKDMGGWDAGDLSLWKGGVTDDLHSDVLIGFSSAGCYGWIGTGGEVWHVSAFAGPGNDWSAPGCRMWSETIADMYRDPAERFLCMSDRVRRNVQKMAAGTGTSAAIGAGRGTTTLECTVAVETDYQLYQQFGNLNAEQNYMAQLLAAISDRYNTEIDVVLTYPYLMYHTTSNDGWTTQESGGGAGDLLTEFRTAWAGNIPTDANLAHFISGASLGGGVAYLDVLCNDAFGFGVSGSLGGSVNFPVSQGGGNWDFIVVSHELGHNFGTSHTHNYCPPIDECAPNGYFGQCQSTQQCSNQGTIMSYCHLCSGGTSNITTFFHPQVKTVMRAAAEGSCLQPYDGGGGNCDDDAAEPNDTCATATVIGTGMTTGMKAKDANLDIYSITVPDNGSLVVDVLFSDAAGDIDARLQDASCTLQLDSSTSNTDNEQLTWQNLSGGPVEVKLTVFNFDGADCYDYDLNVDIQVDPCAGTIEDIYEGNDSCGNAAPIGGGFYFGLTVEKSDVDFYEINVEAGATLAITTSFLHATADVDVYLYDPSVSCGDNNVYLTRGFSGTDNEAISWTNTGLGAATYVLEVQVYSGSAGDCSNYTLTIDPGQSPYIGSSYCPEVTPNSTGSVGRMTAQGSVDVLDNDVTLLAYNLPSQAFGYFIVSANSGVVPNPGGSSGTLCLFPPFGRYLAFAQPTLPGGTSSIPVDLNAIPQPTSLATVMPGETWHFQFWHRDSFLGVPTSNFSEGLSIAFE